MTTTTPMGILVPFGYGGNREAARQLEALMGKYPIAYLCDVRRSPTCSWSRVWTQEGLREVWGDRYRHFPSLGNATYDQPDAPIHLVDADTGIPMLVAALRRGYPLVILCGCGSYSTCHRQDVCLEVLCYLPEVRIVQPEEVLA